MILPPGLSSDERWLALALDAMDKKRALAVSENDLLAQAEVDGWFHTHAAAIRPIRDKIEAAEFDA